ncbi:hypothetical protein MKX01_032181 [Papaver californicum]|nr:hypothetical protein MKX01_032181 [Papaver californicum]
MEVYTRGVAKPDPTTTSEEGKKHVNDDTPPLPPQGMRYVAPAPNPSMGNWRVMPPLDNTRQQTTSRWREEDPDICIMRKFIRSRIEQILLSCNRNSNQWNQVKFQNFSNYVEYKVFMEASTKAEHGDVATLKNRVKFAVRSGEGKKMEIISNQSMMPPLLHHFRRQQEYLLDQQQFPVQGVVSPSHNISGLLSIDRLEGSLNKSSNSSRTVMTLLIFSFKTISRSRITFKSLSFRIVHSNSEAHQATMQHNAWKAAVPFTFDAAGTSAKPGENNYGTRKVDGDISPAIEISFKKQKIGYTSNLPLSTDHRAPGEMHPRTPFSGYEISPEWGPLPLLVSPQKSLQKHQQWMSYKPSITEVDMNELVDSNKQEPILNNLLYKGKAEEEKSLHPQKRYLEEEDYFWSKEIKEPDKHIETPICQAEIVEVDKLLGLDHSKTRGASLTEMLTLDQLEEHLASLKHRETFFFAIGGCFLCGKVFKKTDTYHNASKSGMECRVCNKCFKKSEGQKLSVDFSGLHINEQKRQLENDLTCQEPFVQCDICDCWQHHTCALFNNERIIGGKAEYKCPKCYTQEIKNGLRIPLDWSVIRGVTDLPRTKLGDYIEGRLFSRLKQERDDRVKGMGKNSDEVPGAEDIVVRVVLSVEKKLLVKQEFLDAFKEANYPKELPYRSKVILLFQKVHGVEVCLFGMYVQEYGYKCPQPNQRSIYISYLDSVKYFRPDGVRTAAGEPLRTFVYHEILVGYLDYCRTRGFSKCYIWSSPPIKSR